MAFGLDGDCALRYELLSVALQPPGILVAGVVLNLAVLQDGLAVDLVADGAAAVHFNLHGDPLISMVGL